MREKKRRLEMFSFYDHTGLEAHLAGMAARGWLLEKIGFFWTYRRTEPKKLTFSVCYFPKASAFDPEPGEEQQTFYDLCEHTGWTLAASSVQMQVFCNERENPVPIATDPALEVESIHRAAKKGFLPSQLMLLALAVFQLGTLLWRLLESPIDALSTTAYLFLMLCWPLLILMVGTDLACYFSWRSRARKAAEQGEFLATKSRPAFQLAALAVLLAGFVWWLASAVAAGGSPGLAAMIGLCLAYAAVLLLILYGVRGLLKRKKVPAGANKLVTYGLYAFVSLLMLALIPAFVFSAGRQGWPEQSRDTGELSLTVEDLVGTDYDGYRWDCNVQQSPLLTKLVVRQRFQLRTNGGSVQEAYWVDYTVVAVRAPFLYGVCRDQMLRQYDTRSDSRIPEGSKRWYEPADPAPWGALEVYQEFYQDTGLSDTYLLCYPDCMVEIGFDWTPTPEQMTAVAEKLGGGTL